MARHPRARDRCGSARHRSCRLQAPRIRHQLGHYRSRRRAVCVLPGVCVGRSILALSHHSVCRNGDSRRHGLACRRLAGSRIRHAVSLWHRASAAVAAGSPALCERAVCGELRRLWPGHAAVSDVRARWARRHLAPDAELFPALAVQASSRCRIAPMTLLALNKLEVVYQRSITAVQGVSLCVEKGQIVALLGPNGAGKTTTLRAISGFLGIDDARVTDGSIVFSGTRIENAAPHDNARRGIVLVPERDKVFPNLTVAENLLVPRPRAMT